MLKPTEKILIIDDETFYIDVLVELLAQKFVVSVAKNGEQGLERIRRGFLPDLILLDVLMPGLDGYQVCQQLKAMPETKDIPIIFLTVKSDVESEIHGFNLGAADYISKPFSLPIVSARVNTHMVLARMHKTLQQQNSQLEELVNQRTKEISRTQDVAIYCMASVAETRDNETGKHLRRTQHYIKLLAEYLREQGFYTAQLDNDFVELLFKSAPLHDIGKVGVPDAILLKSGPLDATEWQEMQKHSEYGRDAILKAEKEYGPSSFLSIAKEIAYNHHEKWDGSGYPRGLSGEQIPLSARLMAIADCYDALINKRSYKQAFSYQSAKEIILQGRGSHFEPALVDAFIALEASFIKIAQQFAEDEDE
ncbi:MULTISPECIES: HD-GYP domain-containing protein [unclassified Agarivorans]|uniref:HD-GYP domain-containing protein n=1 Tax=unclassified Agarivorans TaxID=2636026 RepID=UPI003D7CCAF5